MNIKIKIDINIKIKIKMDMNMIAYIQIMAEDAKCTKNGALFQRKGQRECSNFSTQRQRFDVGLRIFISS